MPDPSGYSIQASVGIPFDDANGHHAEGEYVMIPAGTWEELDNLRRLVSYGIVQADIPDSPGPTVPAPAETPPPVATDPTPPPAIPPPGLPEGR